MRLPPFLQYADWVLDDLGAPLDEARWALEDALFQVAAFGMVAALVVEQVQDRQPGAASTDLLLVQVIQRWADEALAGIGHAGAFELATEFSTEQAEALAIWRQVHVGRVLAFTDTERASDRRLAITRLAPAIAAQHSGHPEMLSALLEVVDELNALHLLRGELMGMPSDAAQGHYSRPLTDALLAVGFVGPHLPSVEEALGASITSEAILPLARQAAQRSTVLVERARGVGLVSFAEHANTLPVAFQEIETLFTFSRSLRGLKPAAPTPRHESRPIGASPRMRQASSMAEGFLLEDAELREAWEVHRWGLLGVGVLTGRTFPVGFVLEHAAAGGAPVADQIHAAINRYVANKFQYFDEPNPLPPEIDTLGMILRLAAAAQAGSDVLVQLEPMRALVVASTAASGSLPVYIRDALSPLRWSAPNVDDPLLDESCVACEAGYLEGLLLHAAEIDAHAEFVAGHVLRTVAATGVGAALYYPPLPATWIVARLVANLDRRIDAFHRLRGPLNAARDTLVTMLDRERRRSRITAQDAALLSLTTRRLQSGDPEDIWLDVLLRDQRPDGGWAAEPLYWIPTLGVLGGVYSSRLATSALCFQAIREWE